MEEHVKPNHAVSRAGLGCAVRFFWMAAGNAVLLFAALYIAGARSGAWPHVVFWVATAALAVARLVDVRWLGGMTSDGEPATADDLRAYLLRLAGVAAGVWLAAVALARLGWLR